jgi:hypothetical protein
MAVYEGILGTMSGGTQQTSMNASDAFVRLEFITIGDQRLKSIRMSTFHAELLRTVIGQPVAVSVSQGASRNDLVVAAVRLPDGSIEKAPKQHVPGRFMAGFNVFRISVFFFTVGYIADMLNARLVIIPAVVLEVIVVFGFLQTMTRSSSMVSTFNASIDDLDGRAFRQSAAG